MQREFARSEAGRGNGTENLIGVLHASAELKGDGVALAHKVEGEWRNISYRELYARVRYLASGLYGLGVRGGDMVALISANRPEWPVSDLAIQSLGAATVPVYPTLEVAQFAHVLRDCGARVAIVENQELLEKVEGMRGGLPVLETVILMEGESEASLGELERRGRENPISGWEEGWRAIGPEDAASVIYTSGTTGLPKGVVLTHGNFLSNLYGIRRALPTHEEDVFLSMLPLSHVFERTCGHYLALISGGALYYAESIEKVTENMREVRPTLALSVPRLYEKMYDRVRQQAKAGSSLRRRLFEAALEAGRERYAVEKEGGRPGRGLSLRLALYDRLVYRKVRAAFGGRLGYFVSGGAKLNPKIGEFFYALGVKIIEGYGLTETTPVISCNRLERTRFGTVGLPLYNVEVKVSGDGEVLARGPSIMRGYLNDEEATHKVLTEDGWFHTGDLGEFDEAGYLKITDRLKHLIVLSTGKNVAPAPIEAAMCAAPHVSQALLLGEGRKYVCALIAPDYEAVRRTLGAEASNSELNSDARVRELVQREIDEATKEFAAYERPKRFALLEREFSQEEGELTPTLKVKAGVVAERYDKLIESMYAQEGGV
jgi:long-chain acyl-CoA synthetase